MLKKTFLFFLLFLLCNGQYSFGASSEKQIFNKDIDYNVYYTLTDHEVAIIKKITVVKIVEIGEKRFLEIEGSKASIQKKKGYIDLDRIIAILPSNKIFPHQIQKK